MANAQARPAIWVKLLAACGIVTPILDVLVTIGLAAMDPNYSHTRQYISELGEPGRPYAIVFNVWCIIYGLLFAGFAVSLGYVLGSRAVFIICLVLAASSIIGAIFPCDPGGTVHSATAEVHLISGYVGLAGIILTPIFAWRAMKASPLWRGYEVLSLAIAGLLVVGVVWLGACHFLSRNDEDCAAGAAQRLILAAFYVWMVAVAVRTCRMNATD